MQKKELLFILLTVVGLAAILYFTGMGCPILKLTGIPCFGCGMTRAAICLVHLDFVGAWEYHPLVYLMPFCVVTLLLAKRISKQWVKRIVIIVLLLFVVTYGVRLFNPTDDIVKWHVENGIIYKTNIRRGF